MAFISLDTRRTIGTVHPEIFGGFIEHLGRCIYGGIFDEGSSLANGKGFRMDVMEALRDMYTPILRWPGGNFVSNYHWEDGIGPRDERPVRPDLAWNVTESNRFGTVEFIEYCRELGCQPYICTNLGTGTPEEAARWVEYCNMPTGTSVSDLRAEAGHTEPFNVHWWGLGNEMSGDWQIGYLSAEDYALKARSASVMMKEVDGSIETVASGAIGEKVDYFDWDRTVLEVCGDRIDHLAPHLYIGNADYETHMALSLMGELEIDRVRGLVSSMCASGKVKQRKGIVFDEWNVWYRKHDLEHSEPYDLRDALVDASFLNSFIRNCDVVRMANIAQNVNVLAPIRTSPEGLFLQTIYWTMQMYSISAGGKALDIHVETDGFSTSAHHPSMKELVVEDVPYLDCSAVYLPGNEGGTGLSEEQGIALFMVNRHRTDTMEVDLESIRDIDGTGELVELWHEDDSTSNSFEEPRNLTPSGPMDIEVGRNTRLELKPHSLNRLVVRW